MGAEILSASGADVRGQVVDHYTLLRVLGRGGMGEVYLARDQRLGRKVALKMVHPHALGSEAAQRFMREAQITARFNHPNIVTVYGVGEYAGQPYVALEYLDGVTLRDRLQTALTAREAMRLGLAIASALAEAHKHGILHRDLKPENVIIPQDGRLRVVDFGLARSFTVQTDGASHRLPAGAATAAATTAPGVATVRVDADPNATRVDVRLSGLAQGVATVQVDRLPASAGAASSADIATVHIDPKDLSPADGSAGGSAGGNAGETRAIPIGAALALIDGALSDLTPTLTLPDDRALLRYCYQVAGTVGVMMCGALGVQDPAALPHAIDLGVGMQLTNICRDVLEDAQRRRVYLPAQRLQAQGLDPRALLDAPSHAPSEPLARVVADLLALAERYYDSAGWLLLSARADAPGDHRVGVDVSGHRSQVGAFRLSGVAWARGGRQAC